MDVEEPVDERALEPRPGALVDGKARARDLGAARVVDDVQRFADLPVRLAPPGRAAFGGVGTDLAVPRLLGGELLAPRPDRDVRLLAPDRNVRVGGVRDAQEQLVEVGLDLGEGRVELFDLLAGLGGGPLELRHLGTVGGGAFLDRRSDLLRCVVALRLEGLGLRQQPPRSASSPSARSTSDGSSPLSMAPLRTTSGSSRSLGRPTLMPSRLPSRPRGGASRRSPGRATRGASRHADRCCGQGTHGRSRRTHARRADRRASPS